MFEWIERRFKSAYLKLLEDEIKRLREENRQLVNSILASHNMPQIDAPRAEKDLVPLKRPNWIDYRRQKEREVAKAVPAPVAPAPETKEGKNA